MLPVTSTARSAAMSMSRGAELAALHPAEAGKGEVAMSDINWGKVFFVSMLGFMLVMLAFVGISSAGAWDPRDPEVVSVQGTVEGRNVYTVAWMKRFTAKAEARYGKERGTKAAALLGDLKAKSAAFEAYALKLKGDAEVGTTMRPNNPKLKKLDELNAAANEPMFELMRLVAQSGK